MSERHVLDHRGPVEVGNARGTARPERALPARLRRNGKHCRDISHWHREVYEHIRGSLVAEIVDAVPIWVRGSGDSARHVVGREVRKRVRAPARNPPSWQRLGGGGTRRCVRVRSWVEELDDLSVAARVNAHVEVDCAVEVGVHADSGNATEGGGVFGVTDAQSETEQVIGHVVCAQVVKRGVPAGVEDITNEVGASCVRLRVSNRIKGWPNHYGSPSFAAVETEFGDAKRQQQSQW